MTNESTTALTRDDTKHVKISNVRDRFEAKTSTLGSTPGEGIASQTIESSQDQTDGPLFILKPPAPPAPTIGKFEAEQEFEGAVVAVDDSDGTFTARLVDLSHGGLDEEGEFSLREISEDDRFLVVPGATFSWVIGLQWRKKQSIRVSEIRFRRLPPFSREAIAQAEAHALELSKLLSAQDDDTTRPSSR